MPIDSVYSESTLAYGKGQNDANLPGPPVPTPSTSIGSIAGDVARGIGYGGARLFGMASDLTAGASQLYADPDSGINPDNQAQQDQQINAALGKLQTGSLFQSALGKDAYNFAESLKPDANNATAIDQVVQGVVGIGTQFIGAALSGPFGAALGGLSVGMGRSEDLKRQGVDVGTRTGIGALEGGVAGASGMLSLGAPTLLGAAKFAGINLGASIGQGFAEKAILKNAGYDHLADQEDPLDSTNIIANVALSSLLSAAHIGGAKLAAKGETAALQGSSVPLTDIPLDQRKKLNFDSAPLDNYAVQAAQREGVPPWFLLFIKNAGERSNSNQTSSAGAKGVMQFVPDTWKQYGNGADPTDPVASIDAAARYAKDLGQRYDGNWRAAAAEYNGGIAQAKIVQEGGAPTLAETQKYLAHYDRFTAERAINNTSFNPSPDQVDAAMGAHAQRIVDDANPLPEGDIVGMDQHQEAFNLAVRQMGEGGIPNVTDLIPDNDLTRANMVDSLISDAESFRSNLAASAGNLAEPGAVANMRSELSALQSVVPDTSTQGIKALAKQYQDTERLSYKQALSRAQKETAAAFDAHDEQIRRLQGMIDQNAEAQRAYQQLTVIDRHVSDMRAARAEIDAPYTRRTAIADAVRGLDREETPSRETAVSRKALADMQSESGSAEPVNARDITAAIRRTATANYAQGAGVAPDAVPAAVDARLREHALTNTETPYYLDANGGEHYAPASELLKTIDEEHTASTKDADLLTVAANCFISG